MVIWGWCYEEIIWNGFSCFVFRYYWGIEVEVKVFWDWVWVREF